MAVIAKVFGNSEHDLSQQTTGNPNSQSENAFHDGLTLGWCNNVIYCDLPSVIALIALKLLNCFAV
jgi:hypothetical protein